MIWNIRPGHRVTVLRAVMSVLSAAFCAQRISTAAVVTRRIALSAEDAFKRGTDAGGVRRNLKGRGVVLYDHTLVEDDGPGIKTDIRWSKTEQGPTVTIADSTRVKKVLHVQRPGALEARLYGPRRVIIEVNGKRVPDQGDTRYPKVPVSFLKKGDNEVVLYGNGRTQKLKIAPPEAILLNAPERKGRPRRSFKSTDGGRTWQPIEGECMVRLHLIQYREQGDLVGPVIDLWTVPDDGATLALSRVPVRSVRIIGQADTPRGTRVEYAVRTGPGPVYEEALWSKWQPGGAAVPRRHRYVQWKATLRTADPVKTPVLERVTVEAKVLAASAPAWTARVKVVGRHNEEMLYTSIPFAYEDPSHPKLKLLRQKYKLDEVVKDGKTEFEKQVRLRNWVSKQWRFKAPAEYYPAWDAHDILEHKIGFCVQYAIVYIHCCSALGWQARFVFGYHPGIPGSGHEVTEAWSNQYRKWVFMDPSGNRHHIDPKTKVPLSMLEIHDRLVRAYYEGGKVDRQKRPREPRGSEEIATCPGLQLEPSRPHDGDVKKWPPWRKWLYVRYVPRNDFYTRPRPIPLVQGWNWDWPDYLVWSDAETPMQWQYRNLTARRSDLNWTLNQVRFGAVCGEAPGTVEIRMGTFTPYFETFLVNVDGKGWKKSNRAFTWRLRRGRNRLDMRVRNTAGVEGPISFIELDYGQ